MTRDDTPDESGHTDGDGGEGSDAPRDPKADRQARLLRALQLGIVFVLAFALVGALAPEPWDRHAARATAFLLVLFPVGRVAWLGIRWLRKGDRRFAGVAVALLLVIGSGALLAN